MAITVLNETELRQCVELDMEAVQAVADAFTALAQGGVVMPPVVHLEVPDKNGEMDVKTAYVPGFDAFALKVSTGFFDNPQKGLPSLSGLMNLIDSDTGRVRAVLLDNGYLTDVRTAAAGAVAAQHCARTDAKVVGVYGTGLQARLQVEALQLVRDVEKVLIWGRDAEKAEKLAAYFRDEVWLEAEARSDPASVAGEADIVVTTTPAREPILKADWLQPGVHVTAMGSDAAGKNEIDPQIFAKADHLVVDKREQCEKLGELRSAVEQGTLPKDAEIVELGELTSGMKAVRVAEAQITLCDLTGTGVQDTAIATVAYRKAREQGLGTQVEG